MKIYITLIILIIFSCTSFPQAAFNKLSTSSKKAEKAFNKSLDYVKYKEFPKAEKEVLKALKADKEFVEAYMLLGDIYAEQKITDKAILAYRQAIDVSRNAYPSLYFVVGSFYLKSSKYEEARTFFIKYLELQKNKNINIEIINSVEKSIAICDFAIKTINKPVPFNPINLGENVNSKYDEYSPVITADDQTLLFTRLIPDAQNSKKLHEDFFVSKRVDGNWEKTFNLGAPINTRNNEGAPTLSPDGSILVFVVCADYDGYGPNREGYGSCDIFFSKKTGDNWSAPRNIGRPINTPAWESHPSFASDGKTLYYVSNRKDGMGGSDIWVTTLDEKGYWTEPENIGAPINTAGNEYSVFIHPDNKTLYFSSDGHVGLGGTDIFMSRKGADGTWGEPVNLGYPINTANDETGFFVNAKGDYAYFASDRKEGLGGFDLYYFELYEEARPLSVTYLKGIVFDSKTNQKLEAKFELINLETGLVEIEAYSDRLNGSFLVCIPTDNDYALNVSKNGYLFYSENFSLSGTKSEVDPFLKNIPLQPIEIGETIVLNNIFFETAKFDLKQESIVELNKLLKFLQNNEAIIVEISGHTDNVGGQELNRVLSENRAKAVYNFLIENNIKTTRLSYKGYGDSFPIQSNDTEEGRAKNRRTEFKIIAK